MSKIAVYIHGKGGSSEEAKFYIPIFKDYDVTGFDYKSLTPWDAKGEFLKFFEPLFSKYNSVNIIANSIGAYFAINSLADLKIDRAFLISPIIDMERLILNIMAGSGITEGDLHDKKEIKTSFGESVSWKYLKYARENPVFWNVKTDILYGENDNLTSYNSISDFADRTGANLTVMKNGEHWFHTEEQMNFLSAWITQSLRR